jgi:hypothetical protein
MRDDIWLRWLWLLGMMCNTFCREICLEIWSHDLYGDLSRNLVTLACCVCTARWLWELVPQPPISRRERYDLVRCMIVIFLCLWMVCTRVTLIWSVLRGMKGSICPKVRFKNSAYGQGLRVWGSGTESSWIKFISSREVLKCLLNGSTMIKRYIIPYPIIYNQSPIIYNRENINDYM